MAQRKTLTEKQIELLRWIGDGCPDGVMEGHSYRVSAAALRNRNLITISGRGPTWKAKICPAGTEYITKVDGPSPPIPRQANVSVTQQLVVDVIAAGGSLRVPQRRWGSAEGVDWEQRARLARLHRRVPPGKRLTTRHVDGELEIGLEDAVPGTDVPLEPVLVPKRVTRLHPVAQLFRDDSAKHLVSRAQLARCVRIIHALATEAERRGFRVANVGGSPNRQYNETWGGQDGHLLVTIRDHGYRLKVLEEGVANRSAFDAETEYRRSVTYPEYLKPRSRARYDANATGRLQITCDGGYGREGRPATWADRRSWTLEDKLPELLQELAVRAAEDDHAAIERQRQAEEHQQQWELAMDRAKRSFAEEYRAKVLRAELSAWQEAHVIAAYLAALEDAHGDDPAAAEWMEWVRNRAENLNPLAQTPRMPETPDPSPDDLKPHLGRVSPMGRRVGR